MPATPHCLHKRPGTSCYQFRRAVPLALRPVLGRAELTASLHTALRKVAERRCTRLVALTDALFAALEERPGAEAARSALELFEDGRKALLAGTGDEAVELEQLGRALASSLAGQMPASAHVPGCTAPVTAGPAPAPTLHPGAYPLLLARYRAAMLSGDDDWRAATRKEELPELREMLAALEAELVDAVALGDGACVEESARAQLEAEGYEPERLAPADLARYAKALLPVELAVVREQRARLNGERIETPPFPEPGPTWEQLVAKWVRVQEPKPRSRSDVEASVMQFRDFVGGAAPDDVSARDAERFRRHLLELPGIGRNRAKTLLSHIRPVFRVGIEEKLLRQLANPFAEVRVRVQDEQVASYDAFETAHLQAFFSSPVYTEGLRPAKGGRDAAYWIPLMGPFLGRRLDELGNLRVDDFHERARRLWVHIGKSKTGNGVGAIPVHRTLIELGLVEYIEARHRADGAQAMLFPALKPHPRDGSLTRYFSTWVNEYIDKYVVDHPRYVFHSLRNNFEDGLTNAGVPEDVRRALCGHAQLGMTARYGRKLKGTNRRRFPDAVLLQAMDALEYEGLDLSHLMPNARKASPHAAFALRPSDSILSAL